MSEQVGVTRDAAGLLHAIERLQPLVLDGAPSADPALVGLMIATAALQRTESRGAHRRVDFPNQLVVDGVRRLTIRIDDVGKQKNALAGPAATQVGA
jgi:L-aspartate oxidase